MTDRAPDTGIATGQGNLELQIGLWRDYLSRRRAIQSPDVAELEDHLREQIDSLIGAGLDPEEAFLIAVKRIGNLDALSLEFAREHSERLWKQLVVAEPDAAKASTFVRKDAVIAWGLAVVAAMLIKLPELFGIRMGGGTEAFYARNLSFFVLPLLAGYFVWKRDVRSWKVRGALLGGFALAAVFANAYPFSPNGQVQVLTILHLPIAVWVAAVGLAYAGARWRDVSGRMDFIRFSGELLIYYVLIALGGAVLTVLVNLVFESIGLDAGVFTGSWILPCGAAGAVLVASWLVEAKQSVIENMAPVLTKLFTPLFAAVLLVFLGTVLFTGRAVDVQREVLIAFDVLLAVVLALVLYTISARDQQAPPGFFDVLQVVLLVSALLADAVALWAIGARIGEFGLSPNKVAALGENVILLVNLAWAAVLYIRFLMKRSGFATVEKWQTDFVPVYAIWAAIVVVAFPPLFAYM